MNIKHENGIVTFLMRTGKDLVRNQMTLGSANSIINKGKVVTEKDGQIIVDDTYFFPTESITKSRKKNKEVKE